MRLLAFAESIQLFPDGTIFIHIALILLMIWVLNRTLFGPVNRVLSSREKHRNVEGGEAGAILAEAADKETVYNREMQQARAEGYELIEKENRKLAKAREKKLSEIKAETSEKVAAERSEIERQTLEARSEIGNEAEKLADKIADSILRS